VIGFEIMKGLMYLGKLIKSYRGYSLSREKQKIVRQSINPRSICDCCLENYKHQTKEGNLLCSICYVEYGNELNK